MIRYERPAEPASFSEKAADHRGLVAESVERGEKAAFEDIWSQHKHHFDKKQHHKCAYCEMKLTSLGDVEHFAPKARVATGRSFEDPETRRTKRRVDPGSEYSSGYWWRAYDWSNYVLACERCNTGFKDVFFPVEPPRTAAPNPDTIETVLLLNPYEEHDPLAHLIFDDLGGISPRDESRRGRATIDVLGLDRQLLQEERSKVAGSASGPIKSLLGELTDAMTDDDIEDVLRRLIRLGDARKAHAAVIRTLVLNELAACDLLLSWDELASLPVVP